MPIAERNLYVAVLLIIKQKGVIYMGKAIQWESDFDEALAQAKTKCKPLLLDFFNPG